MMVTGPMGFVTRPLTVILFAISIAAIVYPIVSDRLTKRRAAKDPAAPLKKEE